jgi:hypothetical protein
MTGYFQIFHLMAPGFVECGYEVKFLESPLIARIL